MHCSMPFYRGDLSSHAFQYLLRVLEQIPGGCQGTTKFWGESKVKDFRLCGDLTSVLFRGQLCITSKI